MAHGQMDPQSKFKFANGASRDIDTNKGQKLEHGRRRKDSKKKPEFGK